MMMKRLIKKLDLIFRFSLSDFKSKYAGSVFGVLWAVAEPLVTILIYIFVYKVALGGNDVDGVPYYIWLSVGIAAWFFLYDGLRSVCASYRDYSRLIKKVKFDKKLLTYIRCNSSLLSHLIFLLLIIIVAAFGGVIYLNFLFVLFCIFFGYLFVAFLGKIFSIVCGYFKDMQNIVNVLLNILFWLTPIFWNENLIPKRYFAVVYYNPFSIIIDGYRYAILNVGNFDIYRWIYFIAVLAVLFVISKIFEKRLLPNISDKL